MIQQKKPDFRGQRSVLWFYYLGFLSCFVFLGCFVDLLVGSFFFVPPVTVVIAVADALPRFPLLSRSTHHKMLWFLTPSNWQLPPPPFQGLPLTEKSSLTKEIILTAPHPRAAHGQRLALQRLALPLVGQFCGVTDAPEPPSLQYIRWPRLDLLFPLSYLHSVTGFF